MPTIYLASTSPARRKILADLGLTVQVLSPDVDEDAAVRDMTGDRTPQAIALHLAKLKAHSALSPDIDGLVIGGDSVFHFDGDIYGKPLTADVATNRWQSMVGNKGTLYSGLWVIDHTGGSFVADVGEVAHATLHFSATVSGAEIDAYVATGEPLNVAGAFTLDGRGGALIDHVEGDPYAVVGMSAASLRRLILTLGHSYHELWSV
jgi:septum formation protein